MTKRGTVLSGLIARMTIGLLSVAALVLCAPIAVATPESDADASITAAWDASGGPTGPLGPKDGGVYPVAEGFGQTFAGGKAFFTPATGAHIMTGAILEKYEALGGPADSDLGFPTIDEGAGRAPGSRNTTFSAADKPVIFWTPETGARVVRGPINAAWDKLGGSAGRLGVPTEDEAYRGDVVNQKFTGGELSYDAKAKTFTTVPPELAGELADLEIPDDPASAINAARRAAGGALALGGAEGPPYPIGGDGLGQNFAGGKIFYSRETGANVVTGQVLAKYESVGGPEGDLGFPTSDEGDGGLAPSSRISTFAAEDKPVIFWTPDYGAVIVRGAMNAAWEKLGGAKGELGAPMADQTENGNVITQRFSGGVVSWDSSTNKFTTEPSNLASELSGLQVPGHEPAKAPNTPQASDTGGDKGFQWHWWWLLAVVPVLLLVGLVAFAAMRGRRSGRDDDRFDAEAGLGLDVPAYSGGPGAADQSTTGDHAAELFGDGYSREVLGSLPSSTVGQRSYPDAPISLWGAPESVDETTEAHPAAAPAVAQEAHDEEQEDPDSVDTTPTRVPTAVERDPLTDTGRHARIEIDEPEPSRTALRLPLDDPNQAPEGYPVKADTKSGLYWSPGSAFYDDARAEIWFASEEIARTNGFVKGD
ncbi:LGFP repeat-containing protein [Mycobacterium sp.]|uniref:LGFP repeat-containing protein n=1 Tax=Mycobacterium sp. TaxID=1785 RepID=UPI002DAD90D5|nr:hypothetical protein [Mycobacterium sp.]